MSHEAAAREIAERVVRQWDEHDRFRDFEDRGEPDEVKLARHVLAYGEPEWDGPVDEPVDEECPCLIADEPCRPGGCTCVKPHSSRGCICCARYGSLKQRKAMANMIVAACREAVRKRSEEWNRNIAEGHPERNRNV